MAGGEMTFVEADVTDEDAVCALVATAVDNHGELGRSDTPVLACGATAERTGPEAAVCRFPDRWALRRSASHHGGLPGCRQRVVGWRVG
jgi:hypothetical protein